MNKQQLSVTEVRQVELGILDYIENAIQKDPQIIDRENSDYDNFLKENQKNVKFQQKLYYFTAPIFRGTIKL